VCRYSRLIVRDKPTTVISHTAANAPTVALHHRDSLNARAAVHAKSWQRPATANEYSGSASQGSSSRSVCSSSSAASDQSS
jgi:hypothetical protein